MSCKQIKNPNKKPALTRSLHNNHHWQTLFFCLFLKKEKIVRAEILYSNMFSKYNVIVYSSKFLTLKPDVQYLSEKSRKKIMFAKKPWTKLQNTKDNRCKIAQRVCTHTQKNSFHINSSFTNLFSRFNKSLTFSWLL